MRIELKDENEEPQVEKEPELKDKHESDLTRKEKMELERQKLSSMGLGGKIQYIWAYYKAVIFSIIGVIILIFVIRDIYQNSKIKTALSVTVIDSIGSNNEETILEIESVLGVDEDPYQEVTLDQSLYTTDGTELDPYGQMAFVTKVAAQTVDVVIAPEGFFKSMEESEYFADLTELLTQEEYDSFGESISQYAITFSADQVGGFLETTYEPIYVGITANSKNVDNAVEWILSLTEEETN